MEKQERRLYFRAAMTLLMMLLTATSAWAEELNYVGYLDPTAPIGMQRKTVLNPGWISYNTAEIGTAGETTWYLVSGTFTNDTRIEVKGTVNLILEDGCNFTASEGLHVPSSSALNIYAQSVANRGSLTATRTNNDAAIGGNGGEDVYDVEGYGTDGESSGKITIYGGIITTTNGNIGGGDGGSGVMGDIYPTYGGNGGNGDVTIYSGIVTTGSYSSIGGGMCGYGYIDENQMDSNNSGIDGRGTVTLSWADASDRIYSFYYYTYGGVTLSKSFVDNNGNSVNKSSTSGKTIKPAGTSYDVTIGSMPEGVTATADLVNTYAVEGQVVTIGFSGVPDGKVPVVSVTYGAYNYEVIIIDNGDGTFSFVMPNDDATVTVSELKNDFTLCTVTVPNQVLGDYVGMYYKFDYANMQKDASIIGAKVTNQSEDELIFGTDYQFGTVNGLNDADPYDKCNVGDQFEVEVVGIGDYVGSQTVTITAINPSGTWGDLAWSITDGTLSITGTGTMNNATDKQYSGYGYPWITYRDDITSIVIGEGITSVANKAFGAHTGEEKYSGVTSVSLPSTLTTIGSYAFDGCTGVTFNVDDLIEQGVTIGENALNQVGCIVGTLSNNGNNSMMLSLMDNARSANITLSGRTLYKDGNWNTICLPFDLGDEEAASGHELDGTPLQGATLMSLANSPASGTGFNASTGTLTLNFVDANTIEAGVPYLVKWNKAADIENPVFESVNVSSTTPGSVTSNDDKVQFIGIYGQKVLDKGDKSTLYLGADNNLYWPDQDVTLGAFRAYFTVDFSDSGNLEVREIRMNLDGDVVTEIHSVSGKRLAVSETAGWFDLFGRKLNGKPTVPGIYYNKGKKIAITE